MYKFNDPITSFVGTVRSQEEYQNLCKTEPWRRGYSLAFSEHGDILDCYDQYVKGLCIASFSNSPLKCFNLETQKPAVENCRLVVNLKKKTMTLVCGIIKEGRNKSKPNFSIAPDTELLWEYGDSFVNYGNDDQAVTVMKK